MKRTHRSLMGIAIVTIIVLTMVIAGQHNIAQADDGCNASTIQGSYGFAIEGLVRPSFSGQPQQIGQFFPLAAVGTFSFDGHGSTSRSFTLNFGGVSFPGSDSGSSYTVNSDCTASATYPDGTWRMVIIGQGKEIKVMNTAPGSVVQGVLTRQ